MLGYVIGFVWERRKQKALVKKATALTDPFLGDRDLRAAVAALENHEWQPLRTLIEQSPDPALARQAILDSSVPIAVVQQWAATDSTSLAYSQLGRAHVRDAWAVRGGARAKKVKEKNWAPFYDNLQSAETACHRAIEINPNDDDPWTVLLTVGRGLGVSSSELQNRFRHAHASRPFNAEACALMLQGLCAKWSGSDEQMFEFARWIDTEAPANSPTRRALPNAHAEMFLNDRRWFKREEVQRELADSLNSFLAATSPKPTPGELQVLNAYMTGFDPTGRHSGQIAAEAMQRIADRPCAKQWAYFGGVRGFVEKSQKLNKKLPRLIKAR